MLMYIYIADCFFKENINDKLKIKELFDDTKFIQTKIWEIELIIFKITF